MKSTIIIISLSPDASALLLFMTFFFFLVHSRTKKLTYQEGVVGMHQNWVYKWIIWKYANDLILGKDLKVVSSLEGAKKLSRCEIQVFTAAARTYFFHFHKCLWVSVTDSIGSTTHSKAMRTVNRVSQRPHHWTEGRRMVLPHHMIGRHMNRFDGTVNMCCDQWEHVLTHGEEAPDAGWQITRRVGCVIECTARTTTTTSAIHAEVQVHYGTV